MKNTDKHRDDARRSGRDDRYDDDNRRLQFLSDVSDYKVASDDPDVRGWAVVDDHDNTVGKVDNLLVDTTREKVRYLDVELDNNNLSDNYEPFKSDDPSGVHEFQKDGEYHMIVPIGLARLDTSNKRVISEDINRRTIEHGHMHHKGEHITPDFERQVVTSLRGESSATMESKERGRVDPADKRADTEQKPISRKDPGSQQKPESGERNREHGLPDGDTVENREMRRPTSEDDRRLSKEADRDRDRTGDNDDDFYENEYFDDRRFYGRK